MVNYIDKTFKVQYTMMQILLRIQNIASILCLLSFLYLFRTILSHIYRLESVKFHNYLIKIAQFLVLLEIDNNTQIM